MDRLYVSLKDLVEENKAKLEQQYWLYQLNREVDELEHWIAEKEVVAGSPELGQDYEHVTVSRAVGDGEDQVPPKARASFLQREDGLMTMGPVGCLFLPLAGLTFPFCLCFLCWLHSALHTPLSTMFWSPRRVLQLLQEKFTEFVNETGNVGNERISAVNQMVDELIDYGHVDAATIAEWKDGVNEAWADLLELMETRAQMLAASHELHKFFSDCKDVLSQIEEKKHRLPEVTAREAKTSASTLQRMLHSFEHDVQVLVTQVRLQRCSPIPGSCCAVNSAQIPNLPRSREGAWQC